MLHVTYSNSIDRIISRCPCALPLLLRRFRAAALEHAVPLPSDFGCCRPFTLATVSMSKVTGAGLKHVVKVRFEEITQVVYGRTTASKPLEMTYYS